MNYRTFTGASGRHLYQHHLRALAFRILLRELGLNQADVMTETVTRKQPTLAWLEQGFPLGAGKFRKLYGQCVITAHLELREAAC